VKKFLPIILVILFGFALRVHRITEIPPGLTHDEANHGRDSINILDGVLLFYFPLNYGSEPLYNYAVAGSMAVIGENLFALRLVNIFAGVLVIASVYLWAGWALGRRTALVAAGLIAVSFWPLAVSRQALRAGMLPFLGALAVIFFWQIVRNAQKQASYEVSHDGDQDVVSGESRRSIPLLAIAAFALTVALTLHTYLAARSLWLIFPIFLGYLAFVHRSIFRRVWLATLAGLVAAGLMVVPMFAYVRAHPEAETRLEMLEGPLRGLLSGDLGPIFSNAGEALLAFVWPGFGDHFLAYNIPGRPVFDALSAMFFVLGIVFSLLKWKRPGFAFLIIWFAVGIIPSLITGPEANTTRNLGALPAAYMLAAVGFVETSRWLLSYRPAIARPVVIAILAIWLSLVGSGSYYDYFIRWSESPDVRAAYQHTLIEALDYVENVEDGPVVISSVYPGAAHDPSIARVLLPAASEELRWVDARQAMVFPNGAASPLIAPSSAPLHPAFFEMVEEVEVATLRPDDLDPTFTVYQLKESRASRASQGANFGNALTLLESRWLEARVRPGETAELLTVWRVTDPSRVGPLVPPAFETDVILFTHVLDTNGDILAQRDALDAPSWAWQAGDVFIQIHTLSIPADAMLGLHETVVGVYDRLSGERVRVVGSDGQDAGTTLAVSPLRLYE
jgi:4-amino-4-deoxy-L-arabinose transferase-like glycosyltransferase